MYQGQIPDYNQPASLSLALEIRQGNRTGRHETKYHWYVLISNARGN